MNRRATAPVSSPRAVRAAPPAAPTPSTPPTAPTTAPKTPTPPGVPAVEFRSADDADVAHATAATDTTATAHVDGPGPAEPAGAASGPSTRAPFGASAADSDDTHDTHGTDAPRMTGDIRDTGVRKGTGGTTSTGDKESAGLPDAAVASTPPAPGLPLLDRPRDDVPPVVEDEGALLAAAASLAGGTGPVGVDAERASGYRYGQRAYLVQLRREGAGTWLVDPACCPDLSPVAEAIGDAEWILHAATQDLPCLAEVGLRPVRLFDTELGARLVGLPRVGLGAVVEHYLGVRLAKEHSAVDWSTRPLPEPWLQYAALDVELLVQLRDAVAADLEAQGKLGWAHEEFAHLVGFTGPAPRVDPWRRTSGLHKIRDRRTLAMVRSLWYARDDIARARDVSPGRVLADAALADIATAAPTTSAELGAASRHKGARRHEAAWLDAIQAARRLPTADLPEQTVRSDAPPPPRAWGDRDPVAAARLTQARAQLTAFADDHDLPLENLLTPDTLRRVLWSPPPPDEDAVRAALAERGARPWQIEVAAPIVLAALVEHA